MTIRTSHLDELIGWYGAVALMLAYALNSFGIILASGIAYQILNITGAAGIVYISLKKRAYQPAALNILWCVVGIIALVRVFFRA